jgi:hypothetical protein
MLLRSLNYICRKTNLRWWLPSRYVCATSLCILSCRATHYVMQDVEVTIPDLSRVTKRFAIEIKPATGSGAGTDPVAYGAGSSTIFRVNKPFVFCAESKDEQEAWLQALCAAAVPDSWPGGLDFGKRPQPLLYSLWLINQRGSTARAPTTKPSTAASPLPKLPALKASFPWQRKALLLKKIRLCSVVFEGESILPGGARLLPR